jgi:hypothetical protein
MRKKNSKKKEQSGPIQASTHGWRATVGCPPVVDQHLDMAKLSLFFEIYLFIYFWKFGEWARAFGRMDVQHLHFIKLAPTLGSVECSIPHGDLRFHFF